MRILCALLLAAGSVSATTLPELERIALQRHPAIAQATAHVRAARGDHRQAGHYPNPSVGITADEVAPGPVIRGGEWGGFLEQRIVTAGKLGNARAIEEQSIAMAEANASEAKLAVLTSIRALFYQALAEQRLVAIRTDLARLTSEAVAITEELENIGQANATDLLAIQIEAERAAVSQVQAELSLAQTRRQLAAACALDLLPHGPLEGDFDGLPDLESADELERVLAGSPEFAHRQSAVEQAGLLIRQAKKQRMPDILAHGGLRYNRELFDVGNQPVGLEGFFDVGVELPLFNRRQGALEAATARLDAAELDQQVLRLDLRQRLAIAWREFVVARAAADANRARMLPKAQSAYELQRRNFDQMAAAYPQVLIARRTLFELREQYTEDTLRAWRAAQNIRGLLVRASIAD